MTDELRERIAGLCAERAGLMVDPANAYHIESRLAPVARREGFDSPLQLAEAVVAAGAEARLVWAAVEAMAVADTGFFRDPAVLDHLWTKIVPDLARRRPDGRVRIWSLGCATGQEIYSLAILQAEAPAPTGPVELYGSDLSERLLDRARSALYSSFEVQRGLSARRLVRHFENRDDRFQLVRELRRQVRWRRVNALDDLSALGGFDVVLCRNVLSGMTEPARTAAARNLAGTLTAGGVLVLSSEEPAPGGAFAPTPGAQGIYAAGQDMLAAA